MDDATKIPPLRLSAGMIRLGLFFVAAVAVIFGARTALDRSRSRLLQPLVNYTLAHGEPSSMPTEVANFFSIPHGDQSPQFRTIKAGSRDGRVHSFAVRARPDSGYVDVLLLDIGANGYGYHYQTTTDGKLFKAVYADTEMREVPEAQERFAKEIKNWLDYLESVGIDEPAR